MLQEPTPLTHLTKPLASDRAGLGVATRNVRMMHFLRRLALQFNEAGIDLMLLKGGALLLTTYDDPAARSMSDLDLLIRPADMDRAFEIIESMGGYRSQILMREDFFPRFYYEAEYTVGDVMPVVMDVHVRPLRPLRYAQFMPTEALWTDARKVFMNDAFVWVPEPARMLIHLTAHLAVHGNSSQKWRDDIQSWTKQFSREMNWDLFLQLARQWRLSLPVLSGLDAAAQGKQLIPPQVREALKTIPVNWRDRLCLRQAPRDNAHPLAHVLANVLTTPGIGFVLGYLYAATVPDQKHMREWYAHEHWGWLPTAHVCRLTRPITKYFKPLWAFLSKTEVLRQEDGSLCLTARRTIHAGQTIGKYAVRAWDGSSRFSVTRQYNDGQTERFTMRGKMRFVSTSVRPNARFDGYQLIAIKRICSEEAICVNLERSTDVTGLKKQGQTTLISQKAA